MKVLSEREGFVRRLSKQLLYVFDAQAETLTVLRAEVLSNNSGPFAEISVIIETLQT
jgi:hypothetical protein